MELGLESSTGRRRNQWSEGEFGQQFTVQSKPARPPHPVLETLSSCLSCAAPLCVVIEKALGGFLFGRSICTWLSALSVLLTGGMGQGPDPVPPRSIASLDEIGPFSCNSTVLQASNSEVNCKQIRYNFSFHQQLMKQKTSRADTHTSLVLI